MPKVCKKSYTEKQGRRAQHVEQGHEQRGMPVLDAERIAWHTENKHSGGGLTGKVGH